MSQKSSFPRYAVGSGPDIVVRLRQALEANETTRVLLNEAPANIADAISLHLDHQDAHLRQIIADLEARME